MALAHSRPMRSIGKLQFWGLTGFFSLGMLVQAAADDRTHLSCEDYDKIIDFVRSEHLRLSLASHAEYLKLQKESLDLMAEKMIEDSRVMNGLDFSRNAEAKKLRALVGKTESLCPHFSNSVHRAYFLKSFINHLDPFSDFYLSDELSQRTSIVDGQFVGVGIGTRLQEGRIEVTEVISGGPSDGSLKVGDLLTHIDGRSVARMNQRIVRQRIRGEKGSVVELIGQRDQKPFEVKIRRDVIHQKSVTHRMTSEDVLFLKIHRFYVQTAPEVQSILNKNKDRTKGIILDLRDNPGGLLQSARDLVDLFIQSGVVVHLRGNLLQDELWALQYSGDIRTPMVVLVNERTASASEIVAGALQDYGRALLVGRPTYGKSSIQNVYDTRTALQTSYSGHLKLTSLWYYLPSGRSVSLLEPDVLVGEASHTERVTMPFAWPERIPVSFFSQQKSRSWMESSEGAEEATKLEEVGEALIRQMMALSMVAE